METQNKTAEFEKVFYEDLHSYLVNLNCIDDHFPDAPDIEGCWAKIGELYARRPQGVQQIPHRVSRLADVYRHGCGQILG